MRSRGNNATQWTVWGQQLEGRTRADPGRASDGSGSNRQQPACVRSCSNRAKHGRFRANTCVVEHRMDVGPNLGQYVCTHSDALGCISVRLTAFGHFENFRFVEFFWMILLVFGFFWFCAVTSIDTIQFGRSFFVRQLFGRRIRLRVVLGK